MKRVVSVSIGSSKRNKSVELTLMGETVRVERIGTDGDMKKAIALIAELDGNVDAIGLGGIDLYIWAGTDRYTFRDASKMAKAAKRTPVVDGSGLKNTLERRVIEYLVNELGFRMKDRKVLLTCAVDRFGMAEALVSAGADVIFGDLIFVLGIPVPLRSIGSLRAVARALAPILVKLPFQMLYPTGEKQEKSKPKHVKYYQWAEVIAGDFHFIKRYMPEDMPGKIVITNTVTQNDVEDLKRRGVSTLITTTPNLDGRSFGTNVMEALIVAFAGIPPDQMTPADYNEWLDRIEFAPRVEKLDSNLA